MEMHPGWLLFLLAAGLAVCFAVQAAVARRRSSAEDKVVQGYFLLGLSGLMAKIALADGKMTDDEVELANCFFGHMGLTDAEEAICVGNFVTARRDGLTVRDHVKRFMVKADASACLFLYDLLWRLSRVDGVLHPGEDAMLKEIATFLGLAPNAYEDFKSGKKVLHDRSALKQVGVPPSLMVHAC